MLRQSACIHAAVNGPTPLSWIAFGLATLVVLSSISMDTNGASNRQSSTPMGNMFTQGIRPNPIDSKWGPGIRDQGSKLGDSPSNRSELGTVVTNISLGGGYFLPSDVAYDPVNGYTYVVSANFNNVSIIQGTSVLTNLGVGSWPDSIAINDSNGLVYVANNDSANVTVLNGTKVVSSLKTGAGAADLTVDQRTGYLYVIDEGSNEVTAIDPLGQGYTIPVRQWPCSILYDSVSGLTYVAICGGPTGLVDIINGTSIQSNLTMGAEPYSFCVNPDNGLVYTLLDYTLLDSGSIGVINGTRLIGNITLPSVPGTCTFDAKDGYIYVADQSGDAVSVVDGLRVLRNVTLSTYSDPFYSVFDPGNGYTYISDAGSSLLTAFNGTSIVGNITVGPLPQELAYDPVDGQIYVVIRGVGLVTVLSTILAISPTATLPGGDPPNSEDMGSFRVFSATLWGIGSGNDIGTWASLPNQGLGCPSAINFTSPSPKFQEGVLNLNCTPTLPGSYTLWFNVTDGVGSRVSSNTILTVYTDPQGTTPVPGGGNGVNATGALIRQNVSFTELPIGGSGIYSEFTWTGLPATNCTNLNSSTVACFFNSPQTITVRANFVDSNGFFNESPALGFTLADRIVAGRVSANRTSADVNQQVTFHSNASAAKGVALAYSWADLPPGCLVVSNADVNCVTTTPGSYNASTTVQDPWGDMATSPRFAFEVFSDPQVTPPVANRSSLDVSQDVEFTTAVYGGSGGLSFDWVGLPANCLTAGVDSEDCTPESPGLVRVGVSYTDSNGMVANSEITKALVVYTDPVISTPVLSGSVVPLGSKVYLSVEVSGGSGNSTVVWSGLPAGCPLIGLTVACTPSLMGNYTIQAIATDGNGFRVFSVERMLDITNATVATSSGYGMIYLVAAGGALVVMSVVLAILFFRKRHKEAAKPVEVST